MVYGGFRVSTNLKPWPKYKIKEKMKINTDNLSVMKGFMSSYGWVKGKTISSIDYKTVPDHICEDFDDDCYDLPMTHWQCWEHDSKCGVCPFLIQEVTEEMDKIK